MSKIQQPGQSAFSRGVKQTFPAKSPPIGAFCFGLRLLMGFAGDLKHLLILVADACL